MTRLTQRRLRAMAEALDARLAGEIDVADDTGLETADYEAARAWAYEQIAKRKGDAE